MVDHWSDCAVHNEPAYPAGACTCGAERLAELKRKLRARKGMREYADNCKAMEAEIKRLEALVENGSA